MEIKQYDISGIPAVLYGSPSTCVYLFLHGKCGYKEEAEAFAGIACAAGFQVLAIDLPEHGARKKMTDAFNPWTVVPELLKLEAYAHSQWRSISVRANSIGAYFAMLAFHDAEFRKMLFVSPILDMERLISNMIAWAGVTEAALRERGEIQTDFGETLSWRYLTWVRAHPIEEWRCQTSILYAGQDNLTGKETVDAFTEKHHATLTVMKNGEHWFHTPEQLKVLAAWEQKNI